VTDNDNLELKKRSRRRLVGAAALALTAAIILPMVMDDEPGVPIQDIQVTIPDREADSLLARPIGGRASVQIEAGAVPAPFEQAPLESAAPDVEIIDPPTVEAPASPPVAALPEPTPPVRQQPPAAPPRREPPAPPPAAAVEPSDEAARVRAILEGRVSGTDPGAGARSASYVVQVGAFGEPGKAASLSADLRGRGFTVFTEEAGAVTRVRVGPFASRSEAERAAERLGAQGLNAVVTVR
jgi:DedD protein